ncbi:MAG: AlpA family phage regulatory protein [Betaproteobacteria bacterium]|nr:AlpA family phage regulatory protein [Betaproteobacteria bacterium]
MKSQVVTTQASDQASQSRAASIPEALRNFDSLPNSAQVRVPVVAGLLGVSPMTVWRMSADGRLPAPRKLSAKVTVWSVAELRQRLKAA